MTSGDGLSGFKFGMSQQAVRDITLMALADLLRARTGWDEAPALLLAYFEDGTVRISGRSLVPEEFWAKGPPSYVLEALADALAGHPLQRHFAEVAPETFFGVVFRGEAWMVRAKEDSEAYESATRASRRRELFKHPQRVETRQAWAMTRAGMLSAMQERGSGEVDVRHMKNVEGIIPDALVTFFRAIVAKLGRDG